ncbi:TPA: hypothetical protein N0F65_006881 [Lagenidium giganteum]|uniref:Uncharacterized protein n=1 Tax=Lagenidium giganteum TaxID=4803 RepID=A0AAV2ZJU5_9STRA|nr:TPA: hypothetical protein N0F65_006881 [Lagenidium giganteum]
MKQMSTRPNTASAQAKCTTTGNDSVDGSSTGSGGQAVAQGKMRPQSAAVTMSSPSRQSAITSRLYGQSNPAISRASAGASSEDLIRDLETKVRRIVEQKRGESDKLKYAVDKRKEDVEKARLILQDLMKDSEALGLNYQPRQVQTVAITAAIAARPDVSRSSIVTQQSNQTEEITGASGTSFTTVSDVSRNQVEDDDGGRLQPIASISRRPVYSKHTKIKDLEARLEKRVKEMHQVYRKTLVYEHIKKRLNNERMDLLQSTNQLKLIYADKSHQTHELHKKDIAAAEAVSLVQTRLAQQKAEIAADIRKYRREVALRQKWAREKSKFEKYYNDQVQSLIYKELQKQIQAPVQTGELHWLVQLEANQRSPSSKRRATSIPELAEAEAEEEHYKAAFHELGLGMTGDTLDPEEVIRICLAHEELRQELDAKHEEEVAKIAHLRESIDKIRTAAREDTPLSKRGTSQKLETKELEISTLERTLTTLVDQYMYVDQSVRPIKIGLQQILQNVSNETINIDNMAALEKSLIETCEEMMRLLHETSDSQTNQAAQQLADGQESALSGSDGPLSIATSDAGTPAADSVAIENFTSPFNVRIPPRPREPYFVPGVTYPPPPKVDEEDVVEETDADVMDRATVKRISSVLLCTSAGKKKDKAHDEPTEHIRGLSPHIRQTPVHRK